MKQRSNSWRVVKAQIESWNEGASMNVPTRYCECYSAVVKYLAPSTHTQARCLTAEAYAGIRSCRNWLACTLPSYKGYYQNYYGDEDGNKQAWIQWAAKLKATTLAKWL